MNVKRLLSCIAMFTVFNAQAQLTLPPQVVAPITPIIDKLPKDLSDIRQGLRDNAVQQQQQLSKVGQRLTKPLFAIPETVAIKAAGGKHILREVITPEGDIAVEREWVLLGRQQDIQALSHPDITVVDARFLPSLSQWVFTVKVSAALDEVSRIRDTLPPSLSAQIARNHVYLSQSGAIPGVPISAKPPIRQCEIPTRVGMIDTQIYTEHAVFQHIQLQQQSFLEEGTPISNIHGTAVAGLLAEEMHAGSQLYNAGVFYQRNSVSQGATLFALINGLEYLAALQVDTINMSLAGPHNPVLESVLKTIDKQGIQVVSAAGNEGPAAPPAYPAAYASTVAVTAVDKANAIYRWANQGDYIDFSALGVSVKTAHPQEEAYRETGTSMAAPRVTARYACALRSSKDRARAMTQLIEMAVDAGEIGRDMVYGYGIIQK